uniref:PAS domain-containing protein n=1 Tax=Desertifilum tharense IPPAS B-1220 TaxID=1781255 RepID=A0ACD5H3P7_9CYAN
MVNFENRYRTKNGEYRWLAWKARPLIEDRLIYAIARDITERKRLESQHLQRLADETAARIQIANILESITDAFFALDRQWRFTYLNHQAERLLQRQRDELLGKNLWEEFPEAIKNDFYTQYHRALTEQVSVTFTEFYPPSTAGFSSAFTPPPKVSPSTSKTSPPANKPKLPSASQKNAIASCLSSTLNPCGLTT